MTYITTNHRFIIDDNHPADVFDEMENFFSLYTVAVDDLQQVSVQLSVPSNFDITANKKLAEGYRQFTKSLKYTIPDIHILPLKTHTQADDSLDDTSSSTHEDDTSVILLIQRLDSYALQDVEKPSLYQTVLGRLMPRFSGEKSDTGLYPEREQITLPTPSPQLPPLQSPSPTNHSPINPTPLPAIQPVAQPISAVSPVPQQPIAQSTVTTRPEPVPPIAAPITPNLNSPQSSTVPMLDARPSTSALPRLLSITTTAKPYQDVLTQAIMAEANKQANLLQGQPITQITLKSSDSLTTAMIEQLFHSFNQAHDKSQSAHDALDLVSYGHEVLKPQLAKLGLTLAEDAQFGLKTNYKAMPADSARLQRGEVFANEIKLGVRLKSDNPQTAASSVIRQTQAQPNHQVISPTSPPPQATHVISPNLSPSLNANRQHITLMIKVRDSLGERQQKITQFPINFVPSEQPSQANTIRLFGLTQTGQASGYFSIVELDGQIMIDAIYSGMVITCQDQVLTSGQVLMPNDILLLNGGIASVQLLLPS